MKIMLKGKKSVFYVVCSLGTTEKLYTHIVCIIESSNIAVHCFVLFSESFRGLFIGLVFSSCFCRSKNEKENRKSIFPLQ